MFTINNSFDIKSLHPFCFLFFWNKLISSFHLIICCSPIFLQLSNSAMLLHSFLPHLTFDLFHDPPAFRRYSSLIAARCFALPTFLSFLLSPNKRIVHFFLPLFGPDESFARSERRENILHRYFIAFFLFFFFKRIKFLIFSLLSLTNQLAVSRKRRSWENSSESMSSPQLHKLNSRNNQNISYFIFATKKDWPQNSAAPSAKEEIRRAI